MLATSYFHTPPSSSPPFASFLPQQPSPLSPRSANIHGPMSRTPPTHKAFSGQENAPNTMPFSKRAVKKAPAPKQDELKERRRNLFLRKVKEGRDDKRFESRGEDIMRLDFMQRQRQWEAEQARDAPFIPTDPPEPEDEEEHDLPSSSNAMQVSQPATQLPDDDVVDDFAQMEDRELEALLEFMPSDAEAMQGQEQAPNLWSDDDEYEELFSELMEREGGAQAHAQGDIAVQEDDEEVMDMS